MDVFCCADRFFVSSNISHPHTNTLSPLLAPHVTLNAMDSNWISFLKLWTNYKYYYYYSPYYYDQHRYRNSIKLFLIPTPKLVNWSVRSRPRYVLPSRAYTHKHGVYRVSYCHRILEIRRPKERKKAITIFICCFCYYPVLPTSSGIIWSWSINARVEGTGINGDTIGWHVWNDTI